MNKLEEYTIAKSTVECYKIRHPSGMYWADITIDAKDRTGRIQIASDWGDYQYYWGACGQSFKDFLKELDIHYSAGKFGADRWFDRDATIKSYKSQVIERRRYDRADPKYARRVYNAIKRLDSHGPHHEGEFLEEAYCNKVLVEFFHHDGICAVQHDISPQFRKFWNTAWQVFLKQLNAEKASGELVSTAPPDDYELSN